MNLLEIWAGKIWNLGAKTSEQLSNCLLRVQTSILRKKWYLQKRFTFFGHFEFRHKETDFCRKKKIRHGCQSWLLTCTEGHFEEKWLPKKTKFFWFFKDTSPKFPNFLKPSGTFVRTAFYVYKWSFCRESNFFQECYLFIFSGVRSIFFDRR